MFCHKLVFVSKLGKTYTLHASLNPTDVSCKINSKSNVSESVDFEKNVITLRFSKNAKYVPWTLAGNFMNQIFWSQ